MDTKLTKEQKHAKWVNISPAIIQKPMHFVFKKFGYKSIEADIARDSAKMGEGHIINRLARRAYGRPDA